jgi:hypothetical protein
MVSKPTANSLPELVAIFVELGPWMIREGNLIYLDPLG